jgi:hypothetical protein
MLLITEVKEMKKLTLLFVAILFLLALVPAVSACPPPPDCGCTLTFGYWKTHSEYGPAPYDDTWAMLPQGADTPFFDTGMTYYEVLWTEPKGGNAFFILAHQYIAAELNVLNGACLPEYVEKAWNNAAMLLDRYDDPPPLIPSGKDRAWAIKLYEKLDAYNNGYMGVPHCD